MFPKIWIFIEIWIFDQNLDFHRNLDFWPTFGFLTKFWIFDQILYTSWPQSKVMWPASMSSCQTFCQIQSDQILNHTPVQV